MGTLITPWYGDNDICQNRSQLVPIELKWSKLRETYHSITNIYILFIRYLVDITSSIAALESREMINHFLCHEAIINSC